MVSCQRRLDQNRYNKVNRSSRRINRSCRRKEPDSRTLNLSHSPFIFFVPLLLNSVRIFPDLVRGASESSLSLRERDRVRILWLAHGATFAAKAGFAVWIIDELISGKGNGSLASGKLLQKPPSLRTGCWSFVASLHQTVIRADESRAAQRALFACSLDPVRQFLFA